MRLRVHRSLPVPLAEAWDALNDLALLQWALPGCEALVQTGAQAFEATMALPVGPLIPRFTARLRRDAIDAPRACTLHFEAATAAGGGSGQADMRLRAEGRDATLLEIEVGVRLDGVLARFCGPLVDGAARRTADEFLDRFVDGIGERHATLHR